MTKALNFEAIVVGGGHAGIEAARALAARGIKVALLSLDAKKIGAMSCNPAIGGVAKSHLVFEVDALGGWMGAAADLNAIQSRRLNLNKGPAVRSTRVQCDKDEYMRTMSSWVRMTPNLSVIEAEASSLMVEKQKIVGLRLKDGSELSTRSVIITAGTFMRGILFCGEKREKGGRFGDSAADLLSESIINGGHRLKRLKTGTPARLNAKSINFEGLEKQWGDPEQRRFSWRGQSTRLPQLACYMTYTNERTHEIIRRNFSKSPLFSGDIQGVGPRYCPSVEDKVKRFPDRARHQIFLEPEGLNVDSIYPNGMSTSLPADVQLEFLRSIVGLEQVELVRPGYAVEYDSIDPTELHSSFMSKHVEGLFFAGQVNRTSGYEEAASQGLWAGINAGQYLLNKESIRPLRHRSYLETLVSDLVSRGTEEPYRMFTSRSEYRLVLREDNAQERFLELGKELSLLGPRQIDTYHALKEETKLLRERILTERKRVGPDRVISYYEYLKRPEVLWEDIAAESSFAGSDLALEQLEIEAKYSGYLDRQEKEIRELGRMQRWGLRQDFDISTIASVSKEIIEKVIAHRPRTVLELSEISGITPSAVLSIAKAAGCSLESVSRETQSR